MKALKFAALGARIAKLCWLRDVKQVEIAQRCGVTKAQVAHWITGRDRPSALDFAIMAKLLEFDAWGLERGGSEADALIHAAVQEKKVAREEAARLAAAAKQARRETNVERRRQAWRDKTYGADFEPKKLPVEMTCPGCGGFHSARLGVCSSCFHLQGWGADRD